MDEKFLVRLQSLQQCAVGYEYCEVNQQAHQTI